LDSSPARIAARDNSFWTAIAAVARTDEFSSGIGHREAYTITIHSYFYRTLGAGDEGRPVLGRSTE
jgi:hypothetical protein